MALAGLAPLLDGPLCGRLDGLVENWRARRFTLLVAGEFKRGKSTLINALVGRPLLPSGMLPVTAVPTRLRAGANDRAEVLFEDGRREAIPIAQAPDYLTETSNPGNRLSVREVLIEAAGLDLPGIDILDLPGLGSVHVHNSEAATAAIPQADLAWLVVSADPPLGSAELVLLKLLAAHATRVELVLNKMDLVEGEGEAGRLLRYTADALARAGHAGLKIWPVAAKPSLEASLQHDELALHRWGLAALRAHVREGVHAERINLLRRSVAGKAARLAGERRVLLEIALAALARNREERRLLHQRFAELAEEREQAWLETGDLLARRFSREFEAPFEEARGAWQSRSGAFLKAVRPGAEAADDALRGVSQFLSEMAPGMILRSAEHSAGIAARLAQAATHWAEEAWGAARELLGVSPLAVEFPEPPPPPTPFVPDLHAPRFALDDAISAAQRMLPSFLREPLRMRRIRREADEAAARGIEQIREACWRRYYGDYRTRLARFTDLGEELQRLIGRVLEGTLDAESPDELARLTMQREKITILEAILVRLAEAP
jgi:GTP-binding protein EngB required for normal cell division